jgi:cytochrome P450
MSLEFDPLAAHANPYPIYRRLRDEAPVHHNPERRVFSVTRFDDVMHVLKTPEIFSSRAMFTMVMAGGNERLPLFHREVLRFMWGLLWKARLNPLGFWTSRNLIAEDGDRHSSMRAIVNRGFTPRQIAAWEPRVREVVEQCVAPLRRGEPFDVVADLAVPVPVTIIAELLGVPTERTATSSAGPTTRIAMTTAPDREKLLDDPDSMGPVLEFIIAMKELARARRAQPRDDLISAILTAQDGEAALDIREVIQFVLLLLVAGNETTTNLIGNLANALLEHPSELHLVAADPSRIPDLVEEGLRYDSPVQVVFPHGDTGHRAARRADSEGLVRRRVPGLGEPRRARLSRSRPARHRPRSLELPGVRLRQALLPRRVARAARDARRVRGARPRAAAARALRADDRAGRVVPGARAEAARSAARRVTASANKG